MDIIAVLQKRLRYKSQVDLAKDIGITPQYLSDVLKGRRAPGPKLLKGLGVRKTVDYEPM